MTGKRRASHLVKINEFESLQQMAYILDMSPVYVSRIFKQDQKRFMDLIIKAKKIKRGIA